MFMYIGLVLCMLMYIVVMEEKKTGQVEGGVHLFMHIDPVLCMIICVSATEKELAKVKKAYEKDTKIYLAREDEEKNLKHKVQVRLMCVKYTLPK